MGGSCIDSKSLSAMALTLSCSILSISSPGYALWCHRLVSIFGAIRRNARSASRKSMMASRCDPALINSSPRRWCAIAIQ